MIKQILLFAFKEHITSDQIDRFSSEYKKLEELHGVVRIEFGPNVSEEEYNQGYTHAAIVTFNDKKSVSNYLRHSQHIQLSESYLDPILEKICIIDIQI